MPFFRDPSSGTLRHLFEALSQISVCKSTPPRIFSPSTRGSSRVSRRPFEIEPTSKRNSGCSGRGLLTQEALGTCRARALTSVAVTEKSRDAAFTLMDRACEGILSTRTTEMMTAEEIMEAIRKLPKDEQQRLLSQFPDALRPSSNGARGGTQLLAAAASLDAGEVLDPAPDHEAIY